MEDSDDYKPESLQKCSYRFLQQTAKRLGLPSNVKKMTLIQLIHAKKFCSMGQVENLVTQVRMERQQLALVRKKAKNKKKNAQQSTEISSTSNSKSPPITSTPKRVSHIMIRYSPDQYIPPKQRIHRQPSRTIGQTAAISASDRVLRSFRSLKNQSYILNNTLIGIIKNSSSEESIKSIGSVRTVSREDKFQQVNMTSLLRKQSIGWRNGNEIVTQEGWKRNKIVSVQRQNSSNMSPQPVRRQRRLSGIYPLNEDTKANMPNVSVRRADGSLSKLNAYIQKSTQNYNETQDREPPLLAIESAESNTTASTLSVENYRDPTTLNTSLDMTSENTFFENSANEMESRISQRETEEHMVYYHKKIRAEHVKSLRSREHVRSNNDCSLPKINDVFTKFNDVYNRDMTQPIYVQVEPETAPHPPLIYPDLQGYQTTMLENLYNLKNVFLVNQPLLQIATTNNTRCVYSTPVITTAKTQPSTKVTSLYDIALSQDNPQYCMDDARLHDFFRNFHCDEGVSDAVIGIRRSSTSADSSESQDLGANVTIPEMVEDALELISQDGDYMERMGMDIRMQCILCNWAGPKIIFECHIRKEHSADIVQSSCSSWCATYTLGALAAGAWRSRVLQHGAGLYVLSAKYEDPDCFCASLATIANEDDIPITGSITTYNKVTGEPYTWEGSIQQLPPSLSYDNNLNCLKLELSRMNLLPNSANLKLLNRELVVPSPNRVVVGQPELDNINITLIVKLQG